MENNPLARVILYTDGTVHFALDSRRTFSCSAAALHEFLQDPINFIQRDILRLPETTNLINPQQRKLDRLGYLSLLYLDSKKELSVRFPEVFQLISTIDQADWEKPLNMSSYIQRTNLSDAKGFLLNFYMKFTQSFDNETAIQNYLDINKDVFFDILREIFNSVFFFEKENTPAVRLDEVVNDAKQKLLIEDAPSNDDDDMVSVTEYAAKYNLRRDTVLGFIREGKLQNYKQFGREYLVDAKEKPPLTKRQQKIQDNKSLDERKALEDSFSTPNVGRIEDTWTHQELKQYIVNNKFFSPIVATYILSWDEFVLYRDNGFRECFFANARFLIKDVDVNLVDKDGVCNRDRMKAGRPPVTASPEGCIQPMELHHMAQRSEAYCMIDKYLHEQNYSLLHQNTPSDTNNHDALFESLKRDFWKWYIKSYEKKNSFDGIDYLFPKMKKKG